ncbi:NAD(P)-binding protein [Aulographum hederae CBS 113979]|uniref:NAD(P)-binding protein n=1 Tax=Aulographum hederae CBS 113979 TaxID=1176131 RepID=A0A6G1H5R2_9PEZI|nr:NAD(P)-binding protein [Aulographum hederae CBS 113979]
MAAAKDFEGKIIVVTGGASGIGLETSKQLAARGAKVSIADLQEAALQEAAKTIEQDGGTVMTTVVDVRKRSQVDAWIEKTVKTWDSKIHGAVNLAGVIGKGIGLKNINETEDDEWDFVIGVNLNGVFNCMRAELNHIEDKGSIVNASSIAGIIGLPKNSPYVASKHAVVGLTRAAAKEYGSRGIRSNCIAPGPIDTPMVRQSEDIMGHGTGLAQIPLGRKGQVHEAANVIVWLLSDSSSYVSGSVQSIDGGWAC